MILSRANCRRSTPPYARSNRPSMSPRDDLAIGPRSPASTLGGERRDQSIERGAGRAIGDAVDAALPEMPLEGPHHRRHFVVEFRPLGNAIAVLAQPSLEGRDRLAG